MIAALLAASLWTPNAIARAQRAIDTVLQAPTLRGAHVGMLAIDADSGATIYERNANDEFLPASTFKLLVGSVALATLPPNAPFSTFVAGADGTLYLKGGGDARLMPADLDAAAEAVAASGSTYDALAADTSRFQAPRYPGGWSVDDLPYGYAAVPSALSVDENVAHVRVVPGDAAGEPAGLRVAPQSDVVAFENVALTGAKDSEDTTDVERPWDRPETIRIVGRYPAGAQPSDDLEPALPDPPAYALDLFRQALARHGVVVRIVRDAPVPAGAIAIWTHASDDVARLMSEFWGPSDNLIGENLLLELGARSSTTAENTRERGIAVERAWLAAAGIDAASFTIADGSGLSRYDLVTPRGLVALLVYDWRSPARETVLGALPLAGVRGTLEKTFAGTPLAGNVFAKTGSLNHTRTLAGYLRTPHRGTVVFALTIDDWTDASPQAVERLNAVRAATLEALRG